MTNAEAAGVLKGLRQTFKSTNPDSFIYPECMRKAEALTRAIAALEGPGREEVARFLAVWRWSNGKPDPGETREPSPLDYEGADAVLALRGRT